MRLAKVAVLVVLVAALIVAGAYVFVSVRSAKGNGASAATAPTFSLTDIYGHPFVLSNYRTTGVVLIEFTALSCSECQIVERSLATMYSGYNATGTTSVHIVSIYIEPQFGDSIPALQAYHAKNNITWTMAQDTSTLAVSSAYGVGGTIPDVRVIDRQGHEVYAQTGVQDTQKLQSTIASALKGTAPAIAIVTVSVFALAALAGVTTFFSPCAFPMFPGYMSLFLGLNAGGGAAAPTSPGGSYRGAARRAAIAGSSTAFGMVIVFLLLGVALILAANAVAGYVPDLMVVIGVSLIALGGLLLTNLQYWRIVTPLQNLWRRIRGTGGETPSITPTPGGGPATNIKLFGYGMGYAAAAAGCVAPVVFSAIIAGLALSLVDGLLTIVIYSLTAALLMIVVTVALAMAQRRFIDRLKAWTPIIKKVSAVALIVVGAYLIYFFYTAWVA